MKKIVALLVAALMALSLCACGDSSSKETKDTEQAVKELAAAIEDAAEEEEEEPAEEEKAEEKEEVKEEKEEKAESADFEPVGYDFGDAYVEVVGAEAFTDSDDKDAVRFYYDFTNTSDEVQSAWWNLDFVAEQAGFELTTTYTEWGEEAEEDGNDDLDIYPGVTLRCIYECNYNPSAGGVITLTVEYNYDESFDVEFDATNLPGVVKEAPEYEFIDDPDLTAGLPMEGEEEDYKIVLTGDYEYAEDYDGNTLLLVNFDFTNNGEEEASAWLETYIDAFQDGIELELGYPADDIEAYDNYSEDIAPGETINCSIAFVLRTDSPVEVYSEVDYFDDIYVGELIELE